MKKRSFNTAAMIAVLCISLVSTGCLGRFAAFNKLSDWNQKATDNKFVNEIVFLALNIIPVYGIALLVDAVVFNSLEFWGEKNPMMTEGDHQKVVESGDLKVVQTFHQDPELKMMTAEYYVQGRLARTLTLTQQTGSPEFIGAVTVSDGSAENFRIESGEAGLTLTRFNAQNRPSAEVVEGPVLQSLSEKIASLINTHTVRLASAH